MLHDQDIREPLFDFLEETFGQVRILEEKTMGKSRADVLMITEDAICGIEIKSDADTYARLKSQVTDYDRFFDRNFAVVGTSHALHIREHVPEYWGVITVEEVDGELDFYILREAAPNPKVQWKKKMSILWRPELSLLQEAFQMPKYKEKGREFVIQKIVERIGEEEVVEEPRAKKGDEEPTEKRANRSLKGRIDPIVLQRKISEILFERDYNSVPELLQEYRRGEIEKQLERELDPEKQIELLMKRETALQNLRPRRRKRRRRGK